MGLHRDPRRWRLSHDRAEERRVVFWECNTADICQVSGTTWMGLTRRPPASLDR